MMKRLLLLVCLFVCLWTFVACQQHTSYTIHGDISNLLKNDESIVGVDSIFLVVDEVAIGTRLTDGIFEFKGEVEEPVLAELRVKVKIVGGIRTNSISLILEPGHAIVKVNEKGGIEVSGTPLNDSFRDAIQRYVKKRQEGKTDEVKQLIREYCVAHKEDETAVLMLLVAPNVLEETEILKLIEQCHERIQSREVILRLKERLLKKLNAPKVGELYRDFAVEYQGKTLRLSDYVGRGQYVLVDFWASWCMPCRREIPNLIAVYNKYKKQGLVVLGVAVNDKPEDTQKVIDSEKIPYPQLLNTQMIAINAYAIQAIPTIILFAPDGKILSRGLRGKEIEEKLAETFGF